MNAQMSLQNDVTVISLSGRMNIEKAAFLRSACIKQFQNKKVVFCLNALHFVGSSGIQTLFQMMEELKASFGCEVKMAGLNPDFQRLWQYGQKSPLEVHENIEKALVSFRTPHTEII